MASVIEPGIDLMFKPPYVSTFQNNLATGMVLFPAGLSVLVLVRVAQLVERQGHMSVPHCGKTFRKEYINHRWQLAGSVRILVSMDHCARRLPVIRPHSQRATPSDGGRMNTGT